MTDDKPRAERRSDALSKGRIIRAATEILDESGTDALTFRTLAARLSTGPGAIYHHVAGRGDLLAAAAEAVMTSVLDRDEENESRPDIRTVMLAAFDAISTHPWVGTQLASAPWQPAVLHLFERVGQELEALGVRDDAQFDAASVLVHHVLGVASQYDAGSRLTGMEKGRSAFLESARSDLVQTAAGVEYPFLTRIAGQLSAHDDREQFSAGVGIILAGIQSL